MGTVTSNSNSSKGQLDVAGKEMLDAEQLVKDYLVKSGLVQEDGYTDAEKAERMKAKRKQNYLNVESLLRQYRNLSKTYEVFIEDFGAQLADEVHIGEDGDSPKSKNSFFERVADRLQMVDAADERRFQRIYAPQIETGKRIGAALDALEFGLRVLQKQDKEAYMLLRRIYIDGESAPTIRDVISEFGFSGNSAYYSKVDSARKKLTKAIFGFTSNRAELMSILVFLRQQFEDDDFPDF